MRGNEANRVISVSQGGLYHCRGGRGDPVYYTEDSSDDTVMQNIPSKPTVTLQPSWPQIYSGETVTVRCEIQGGEGAQWTYEWRQNKLNTPPTSNEYRIITVTESDGGEYSCRGRMGYFLTQWSKIITLTVSYPVLTVSPSWLSPGASVTLNCEVEHPSAGWSFYWYKAVPDLSEKSSSYELLPDGSGTAQDSYIIHGQTHTAGYVCRAGRGDPEYHTDHSQPKFVWSADVHSAASLTVSPDRVQHFTSDSVSLTCEGNFTEWRVRKFSEDGRLSDCWRMTGSTCDINTSKSDTAVYWCESGSGEFSSAVNITVQSMLLYIYFLDLNDLDIK
ncbi:Fc receptor-like protein 5 [Maylandia zebra]|uniref:Fc receptor-like protein 5 n=1 Tax=Maylandia zebra TaxID=106582 RepID=UPI00403CCBCF